MDLRVFLLDDHEIVRRGVHDLLEAEDDIVVVGEAATAAQALRRIPATLPDVAILDVRLPDGSGIEVCRQVRSAHPQVRALVLTSFDDDAALLAAIVAGASGYVLKQIRSAALVEAVRRVGAGQSLIDPDASARVLARAVEGERGDPRLAALTPSEREVLAGVADGLTNRQIGERLFIAEKTVKNHVTSLLGKLGMASRTQAAVFAVRQPERS